ncbi:2-oxo acid dehydrogenase subunit E2 [Candidatus Pelagibacter sp.]|jgi:pyruvate dehydrogenase E2 component (dihydrolipoamide acetyltransferase)|nr:2-oxo acid dehydrogenase subunit E2 [Pseudomonadota bacterium]MDC1176882.1 2-oxo acid dehydrogenase subunit E2 [Candidatus Pelagibacter sp.]NDG89646.1 dihydrolipoamide acetyltransferase [Pseudomonadota bacterium]
MSLIDLKVPNIGEFKDVEVIEVLVSEGQSIEKNDPLITIESDKSSVEIPSTEKGKVVNVTVKVGDKISEGSKILEIEVSKSSDAAKTNEIINNNEQSLPKSDVKIEDRISQITPSQNIRSKSFNDNSLALASPKVRKFARELGVNINSIYGTERQGRVTETDIKNYISNNQKASLDRKEEKSPKKINLEYAHSEFGEIETKDMPRVKKLASTYLMNSWSNIPHVTNHDEIDITELEDFRNSLTDIYTGEKKKITPLAFIIKALVASLKKFPSFNSSIDEIDSGKMTLKKYYHIGIAVDTPHGLMVPKIRDANNKSISVISKDLKEVSDLCRNLKIDKKELFGGSMTITSLGGIGGSFFTPIINYPEVAILGVGKSQKKQIFINDKFVTRTMLPISLSYDHRIIDGAEAARFNNDLKDNLGKNFAYKLAV